MNEMIKKARTIQEKRRAYSENTEIDYSYLNEWRNTKTLLKDKYYHEMLAQNNMTEKEFAFSLQPEIDLDNLTEDEWYNIYTEIMEEFSEDKIDTKAGVGLVTLPFSVYFTKKIKNFINGLEHIEVTNKAINSFVQSHVTEMFSITGKLVALRLAIYKEHHKFTARNKKKQFTEFLENTFNKKEDFINFFENYPVAARVATVRTLYLVKNYTDILQHLDKDYEEIEKFIDCKKLTLTDISLSTGDSHAQGNAVSILKFGNKKLVYKPKDLKINKAFEKFTDWCAKTSGMLDVRIPKGIYKDSYAYNEFIEKKYCKSEKEVERFYTRYGYLVAICYLLNINDLHLENIVAHGEYPIIIDMETLFQVPASIGQDSAYYNLAKYLELDSVACSLLLPKQIHIGKEESINLSALNGAATELSQEFTAPKDVNTADFHYGNVKGHFAGGNNIPQYDENKNVDVSRYNLVIMEAFEQFMRFIMNHKEEALEALEVFKGKKVRALLKSTERYASMIRYADHPNYNSEMKYRERLMMNIWAYPYRDKRIIKSEVNDLLFNDIPIFFAYTDSEDIIDSHGNIYTQYHNMSGYEATRRKIMQLSDKSVELQKTIMMLSLGIVDPYLNKKIERTEMVNEIKKVNYLEQAKILADDVMLRAYETDDECTFINLDCGKEKHWGLLACDQGLYGGLSGISVVYLELYRKTKEEKYLNYYHKLMKTAVKQSKSTVFESAFTGWFSPIYPMILEKIYFNTVYDLDYLKTTVKHLNAVTTEQLNNIQYNDYIAGFAGIVRILKLVQRYIPELNLSDETINKFTDITIERNTKELEEENIKAGIAHGISGIAYGLVSSGMYESAEIRNMLEKEYHLGINPDNDYKWCWGYPGMIQARIAISRIDSNCVDKKQLNSLIKKFEYMLDESLASDTLCHGNGSIVTTLKMIYDYTKDEKWMKHIDMWISNIFMSFLYEGYKVTKVSGIESKGVFDGIYGIVWMYLYMTGNTNNILLLETEAEL